MSTHDQHESFIRTPQQLITVVIAAFAIPIFGIILLVQLVIAERTADPSAMTPENIAARIQPVGKVEFGGAGSGGQPQPQAAAASAKPGPADGKKVYDSTCTACHAAGVANAPKLGDKAAWAPRIKQAMDALEQSATKGKGAMPPKGGNASLSDADLRAAIEYMVSQAK